MSDTLALTQDLIARASVTPADEGCQDVLASRLERVGFRVERLRYGSVDNLWARHGGDDPVLCFAGHTDVVPTGPLRLLLDGAELDGAAEPDAAAEAPPDELFFVTPLPELATAAMTAIMTIRTASPASPPQPISHLLRFFLGG